MLVRTDLIRSPLAQVTQHSLCWQQTWALFCYRLPHPLIDIYMRCILWHEGDGSFCLQTDKSNCLSYILTFLYLDYVIGKVISTVHESQTSSSLICRILCFPHKNHSFQGVEHCKHTSMCSRSVIVFFLSSAATHPLKYARLFSVLFPLYLTSNSGILCSMLPCVKQLVNIFSSVFLFFNTGPGVGFMLLVPQHRTETLLFIPIGCVYNVISCYPLY